jgi:hypothetical protein
VVATRSLARPDRRTVSAFERTTAALGRSTGRLAGGPRPSSPLGAELRSSLLLFLAVLGLPLLLIIVLAA